MQSRSGIMMISGISNRTAGDSSTNRFTKLGILATIVIVIAASPAQLINYGFFDQRIGALDPGSDNGAFGAIGDIALAAAAVSARVITARVRSARSAAADLAGLLTFLAADKVTRPHDHIPHWLAFCIPLLVASFICLVALVRGPSGSPQFPVDRGVVRTIVGRLIGVGRLLLTFAFLLHMFGERLLLELGVSNPNGLAYQIKTMAKHGTEVAGWLLIALGLVRLWPHPGNRPLGDPKIDPLLRRSCRTLKVEDWTEIPPSVSCGDRWQRVGSPAGGIPDPIYS
jgi:hypothetical protein